MASLLESRPYIGTWNDNTKLVQWTPDALVKINGASTLPGCPQCKGVVRIQDHLTEVSVDAGTEMGSASCSITLSFPKHVGDIIMREGSPILRPGLEIETFMRGYFPVAGLFDDTSTGVVAGVDTSLPEDIQTTTSPKSAKRKYGNTTYTGDAATNQAAAARASEIGASLDNYIRPTPSAQQRTNIQQAYQLLVDKYHFAPSFAIAAVLQANQESGWNPKKLNVNSKTKQVVAIGFFQLNRIGTSIGTGTSYFENGKTAGTAQEAKEQPDKYYNAQDLATNIARWAASVERTPVGKYAKNADLSPAQQFQHLYTNPTGAGDFRYREDGARKADQLNYRQRLGTRMFPDFWGSSTVVWTPLEPTLNPFVGPPELSDTDDTSSASVEEGLPSVLSYPYYPVFHGVVTSVTPSYSGGYVSVSLACSGMLHFWEYQRISTSASIFGERAPNSFLNTTLIGNHYNGMHPYAIMYDLWSNAMGAQDGVGWVLDQKTNQTAVSGITGDSLFSLMGKYWKERFAGRIAKLRMHGFSGSLFTAAQAAFLAGQSSSELTSLVRSRYASANANPTQAHDVTSMSRGLGLFKGRKLDSLVVAENLSDEVAPVELDVGQMVSFVQSISDMGTVNFFESAYQSKADIANTVCGLTGYEFYQDVDGDFVFKPPMYNLDTSSSRVYRIEDIDIINISYPEDEAVVTTARVKGGHFENLMTGAVEGEWGVSGTFIDYPLVAQYGWRPLELETSYLTNPRAMFFYAASQLDLKNAGSTRVSITIPQRPEMRPGFPVYIPMWDCFYYINSLSHSLSFGGDCTTTIQGLAKRAKFSAPGSDERGVDLADTTLNEFLLRTFDESAQEYKTLGFPNVVMTLDPHEIDPLFFLVGSDIDDLSNPQTLENLFKAAAQYGIVERVAGGYQTLASGAFGTDSIFFEVSSQDTPNQGQMSSGISTRVNVQEAANKYADSRNEAIRNKKAASDKALVQQSVVGSLNQMLATTSNTAARESLLQQITVANEEYQRLLRESLATTTDTKHEGLTQLKELIGYLSMAYSTKKGSNGVEGASLYLNMLSDKKASFTNGSIPGTYRYYSASHPNIEDQGPEEVTVSRNLTGGATITYDASYLDPEWDGSPVDTFENVSSNLVRKVSRVPRRGIRIVTGKPTYPNGENMPTSAIRNLSFATVTVQTQTPVSQTNITPVVADISSDLARKLEGDGNPQSQWFNVSNQYWRPVVAGDTAYDYFVSGSGRDQSDWDLFAANIVSSAASSGTAVAFPAFVTPSSTQTEISQKATLPIASAEATLNKGGVWLRGEAMRQFRRNRSLWLEAMSSQNFTPSEISKYVEAFDVVLAQKFGITNPTTQSIPVPEVQRKIETQNVQVPVFPVSDENGYRVLGMYQYGRGISIDPDGVWDSLAAQDPLSLVDAETVQDLLRTYVKGESVEGKSRNQLEQKVLEQLRSANITDADLLNRGLAVERKGGKTEIGLANWLTTGKEGVDYIPVNNVAKSLGDIDQAVTGQQACSCLAMSGFLALENENVAQGALTDALERNIAEKVPQWRGTQNAYRGR